MVNEKLIIGTLGNVVQRTADIQTAIAGLTRLILGRVPGFSEEETRMLEEGAQTMLDDAKRQTEAVEKLKQALAGV